MKKKPVYLSDEQVAAIRLGYPTARLPKPITVPPIQFLTEEGYITRRRDDWTIKELMVAGCYVLIDIGFDVLYIGESSFIWTRLSNHAAAAQDKKGNQAWRETVYITVIPRDGGLISRRKLEQSLQRSIPAKYSKVG